MNFISVLEVDLQDCWFQQDGVMTHNKFSSTNVVRILWWPYCFFKLVVPVISRPTLLDLCIWGFLKENIHKNSLHMFNEMKQNIRLCISSITEETYHQVASNLRKSKCMQCWGWMTFSAPNITLYFFSDCANKLVACWWCIEIQYLFMKLKLCIKFMFLNHKCLTGNKR